MLQEGLSSSNRDRTLAHVLAVDKAVFVRSHLDPYTGWSLFGHRLLCLVCGQGELVPEIPSDREIRDPADSQQVHDCVSQRH